MSIELLHLIIHNQNPRRVTYKQNFTMTSLESLLDVFLLGAIYSPFRVFWVFQGPAAD